MLLTCSCLFYVVTAVFSVTVSPPGMQRKQSGSSCLFQWKVTGEFTSYQVYNKTTGSTVSLSSNANHSVDADKKTISLFIWNIQLKDAGNYSVSLSTGTSEINDAGALLFVYGATQSSVVYVNGTESLTEGQSVVLTCSVTQTSLPPTHRPKLYYHWKSTPFGEFKNISSGSAILLNSGDLFPRYNFENDGRTLVIASLQYLDATGIVCWAQEEGSTSTSTPSITFILTLLHRPYILSLQPPSRKFNARTGETVTLNFAYIANPPTSNVNWSFINEAGISASLPSVAIPTTEAYSFDLSSESFYGQYYFSAANSIGTTTGSFWVLPPGIPDTPSDLRMKYVTSNKISVAWNCMWSNGPQQTVHALLRDMEASFEIETLSVAVATNCYNKSHATLFQNSILPDRNYEISLWSNNSNGSSGVVKLTVRTAKKFRFEVSAKTISLNDTAAVIRFNTLNGKVTHMKVTCCVESTGYCRPELAVIVTTSNEIVYNNLPKGEVYLFDFFSSGSFEQESYFLGMVKGVRVSRSGDEDVNPLRTPVIVLGLLFGVTLIALIGCLIAFLYYKRVSKSNVQEDHLEKSALKLLDETEMKRPSKSVLESLPKSPPEKSQPPKRALPNPKQPKTPKPKSTAAGVPVVEVEQETYEVMEKNPETCDEMYTPLDQPPPTRQKRNVYS